MFPKTFFLILTVFICLPGFSSLSSGKTSTEKVLKQELKSEKKRSFWLMTKISLMEHSFKNWLHKDKTSSSVENNSVSKGDEDGEEDGSKGFHLVGFILGFLLGPIGIILSYVINKDADKANRIKWAWIGWGTAVFLGLLLYAALIVLLLTSGI